MYVIKTLSTLKLTFNKLFFRDQSIFEVKNVLITFSI